MENVLTVLGAVASLLGIVTGLATIIPQVRRRVPRFLRALESRPRLAWFTLAASLLMLLAVATSIAYILRPLPVPLPTVAPDDQQVLNIAVQGRIPDSLDPAFVSDSATLSVIRLVFPNLVTFDDKLAIVGWAAPLPEVSPDGRTYTFHLRPDMRFSDGEPLDAHAFAYSFNRLLDPCTGSPLSGYLDVLLGAAQFHGEVCTPDGKHHALAAGQTGPVVERLIGTAIEERDPRTLVLHLEHPAAYLLGELSFPATAAIPPKLVDQYGAKWTDHLTDGFDSAHGTVHGLGGSLFKVLMRNDNDSQNMNVLTLERNEAFWGPTPAALHTIVVTYVGDPRTLSTIYLYNETDVAYPDHAQAIRDKQNPPPGIQVLTTPTLTVRSFYLDWRLPPFDDVRMRQAFALALDKTVLAQAENFLAGTAPTNHIVPKDMPGYNPNLQGPDGSPDTAALSGNPTHALALATAYAQDHCGGQLSRCPPVVLYTVSNNPSTLERLDALHMWKRALPGYPISTTELDGEEYLHRAASHTLQIGLAGIGPDYPDPQNLLSLGFLPGAPYNLGESDVPEADTLMRNGDLATDQQQRLRDYQEAEQILVTQVASIQISQIQEVYEVRSYVHNYRETPLQVPSLATWARVVIAPHASHTVRPSATSAPGPGASLVESSLPKGGSFPVGIAAGPDGALWFTESAGNQIGRITPDDDIVNEYPLPDAGVFTTTVPGNLAVGPDNDLWFTEPGANRIGRITPQGKIVQFPIPTPESKPDGIVAGPDGALWFTEAAGNQIGRITITGAVTQFPLPAGSMLPTRITRGSDGNLWFTEQGTPAIGRITPSGVITEFPLQVSQLPIGITTGPGGNLWFADGGGDQIGEMSPSGELLHLFPVPAGSTPTGIVVGADGNLWFTAQFANTIGRITPTGAFTQFPLSHPGEFPYGITSGPDGRIWFTLPLANAIGHISP